jgi:pimeloyl-ACP methyl ester carboxylesterase
VFDRLIHKWLRVPYTLAVRYNQRPKKSRAAILFIHGIGNTGDAWHDVIAKLPDDVTIYSIDLLGFGDSPKPEWAKYNTSTQAQSIIATLLKLQVNRRLIIVGHSLGALVAVEVARRYPMLVKSLVLCSPPFYRPTGGGRYYGAVKDRSLRQLYHEVRKHPKQFVQIAQLAFKAGLLNTAFNLNDENIASYVASLEASIINQDSLAHALQLKKPITIFQGLLDPVVNGANLRYLAKNNTNVSLKTVAAGHDVRGLYVGQVVKELKSKLT